MMNKQSLVVGLLLERLADSKVGILVKGINGIQPDEIAAELSSQRSNGVANPRARTTGTPHPQ